MKKHLKLKKYFEERFGVTPPLYKDVKNDMLDGLALISAGRSLVAEKGKSLSVNDVKTLAYELYSAHGRVKDFYFKGEKDVARKIKFLKEYPDFMATLEEKLGETEYNSIFS